jgi:hypothetical protein
MRAASSQAPFSEQGRGNAFETALQKDQEKERLRREAQKARAALQKKWQDKWQDLGQGKWKSKWKSKWNDYTSTSSSASARNNEQLGKQVGNQLGKQVGNQLGKQVGKQVDKQLHKQFVWKTTATNRFGYSGTAYTLLLGQEEKEQEHWWNFVFKGKENAGKENAGKENATKEENVELGFFAVEFHERDSPKDEWLAQTRPDLCGCGNPDIVGQYARLDTFYARRFNDSDDDFCNRSAEHASNLVGFRSKQLPMRTQVAQLLADRLAAVMRARGVTYVEHGMFALDRDTFAMLGFKPHPVRHLWVCKHIAPLDSDKESAITETGAAEPAIAEPTSTTKAKVKAEATPTTVVKADAKDPLSSPVSDMMTFMFWYYFFTS